MKWILILMLAVPAYAQTSEPVQYRFPVRYIDRKPINLVPLFTWWKTNSAAKSLSETNARPLSAWVRVIGTNAGMFSYHWIIDADIETFPGKFVHQRIALRNPPEKDKTKFDRLIAEQTQVTEYRERMKKLSDQNKESAERLAANVRAMYLRGDNRRGENQPYYRPYDYESDVRRLQRLSEEQFHEMLSADDRLARLKQELSNYPIGRIYVVDLFALYTGQTVAGAPVYDLGEIQHP